jgi:hypothetical protein
VTNWCAFGVSGKQLEVSNDLEFEVEDESVREHSVPCDSKIPDERAGSWSEVTQNGKDLNSLYGTFYLFGLPLRWLRGISTSYAFYIIASFLIHKK